MSNYRCPLHTDQAVTWKGTRCPTCATDTAARAAQRAAHRAWLKRRALAEWARP